VGIELGEHPADRTLDQLVLVHRLDVALADEVQHVGEERQIVVVGGRADGPKEDRGGADAGQECKSETELAEAHGRMGLRMRAVHVASPSAGQATGLIRR